MRRPVTSVQVTAEVQQDRGNQKAERQRRTGFGDMRDQECDSNSQHAETGGRTRPSPCPPSGPRSARRWHRPPASANSATPICDKPKTGPVNHKGATVQNNVKAPKPAEMRRHVSRLPRRSIPRYTAITQRARRRLSNRSASGTSRIAVSAMPNNSLRVLPVFSMTIIPESGKATLTRLHRWIEMNVLPIHRV